MSVEAALARLAAAAPRLHALPWPEAQTDLARVMDAWSDPRSSYRRRLLAELPAASGLSRETVAAGLALSLDDWGGSAVAKLLAGELGSRETPPPAGVTAVIHGGVIPMPTLLDLLAPLLLRSPVLSKPGRHDPVTPRLFAESVAEHAPALADGIERIEIDHADDGAWQRLLQAERICVTGGDHAVAAFRKRLGVGSRLIAHGHKVSIAVLGAGVADLETDAQRLAVDVALWDQLGCLSPVACFVLGPPARSVAFADALAVALADQERVWPRGTVDEAAAARIANERASAELRAAAGQNSKLLAGDAWTIVVESDATPRLPCHHRFVRVHPVADLAALRAAVSSLFPLLAGIAFSGLPADATARLTRELGAGHSAPFGRLQAPPLDWARDGFGVLTALLDGQAGAGPGR